MRAVHRPEDEVLRKALLSTWWRRRDAGPTSNTTRAGLEAKEAEKSLAPPVHYSHLYTPKPNLLVLFHQPAGLAELFPVLHNPNKICAFTTSPANSVRARLALPLRAPRWPRFGRQRRLVPNGGNPHRRTQTSCSHRRKKGSIMERSKLTEARNPFQTSTTSEMADTDHPPMPASATATSTADLGYGER